MEKLRGMALEAYDRLIGLWLSEEAVDCCITKAPCGGEMAGGSLSISPAMILLASAWAWRSACNCSRSVALSSAVRSSCGPGVYP